MQISTLFALRLSWIGWSSQEFRSGKPKTLCFTGEAAMRGLMHRMLEPALRPGGEMLARRVPSASKRTRIIVNSSLNKFLHPTWDVR
jgi:hypothetical protein